MNVTMRAHTDTHTHIVARELRSPAALHTHVCVCPCLEVHFHTNAPTHTHRNFELGKGCIVHCCIVGEHTHTIMVGGATEQIDSSSVDVRGGVCCPPSPPLLRVGKVVRSKEVDIRWCTPRLAFVLSLEQKGFA